MEEKYDKSVEACKIALKLAISSREEEREMVLNYKNKKIKDLKIKN